MDDANPNQAGEVDWTGQVLGEFRLLHRLGRGGMGQVYLAEQTSLKRKVALKLLHPELAANERSLLRFKAEAENVARATHANIVQIYTIGQANGVNYIALEYIEGKNLREFIEKKGTPELPLGMHIMMQVAAALQRASELGIIHRDIKPENILLTKKGEVKVADFGLSRCFAEEGQQTITQSQVTMGTPLYMSPEQVERKPVDSRTDIYSFGVTCYHMFAGQPPFRGVSPIEVAYQHVHKAPQLLHEVRPDLHADLCAIVHKMMAKKPEDRYQSAGEIVRDLSRLREALNLGPAVAISISSSFIGGTGPMRGAVTQPWAETPARSTWIWRAVMVASVFLALVAGLAVGFYQNQQAHAVKGAAPNAPDDPTKPPPPQSSEEREKELKQRVSEHLKPEVELDVVAGLNAGVDLGFFYLKERRLTDADLFFKDIGNPERMVPAYRVLGRLGHAFVLAYQDDSAASNKEFLLILSEMEKPDRSTKKDQPAFKGAAVAYKVLWTNNLRMREAVARALNRNFANDPQAFDEKQPAEKLNLYRFPPRPLLKAEK